MATVPLRRNDDAALVEPAPEAVRANGIQSESWIKQRNSRLKVEWQNLADIAVEPNPFCEEWLLGPALEAFDPAGSVKLVTFRKNGQLCGLLPVGQSTSYYGYPIPHVRSWLHDNAFCGLPLVKKGCEHDFWTALIDWASSEFKTALTLHLAHIPEESDLYCALYEALSNGATPAALVSRDERAMLRSPMCAKDYFEASMSGKKRKELRRQERRLGEIGALSFERLTNQTDVEEWAEAFLNLEAAGWKGEEASALASKTATATFFRNSLTAAAKAGKLERLSMTLDGKPIAMLVNFLTSPGAFSFKTTFDEQYARFSPGVLLQKHNLGLLDNRTITWTDSCAAVDHPMIERIWREKRTMLRINIALGGPIRRFAFKQMTKRESGAQPLGDW